MDYNVSRHGYLLVLYIVVAIGFFSMVVLNRRSYQDAWILDGIVIPTVIFIFFFLVIETFVQENKKVVMFAAFLLVTVNLIPGLKYQLFLGCYDTPGHFRFTSELVSLGHIPENEFYSETYGGNSGMHIFMACVSIISGFPIAEVFRIIIPALCGLIPLLIYFMTRGVLDDTIQRYVIIASSLPIVQRYGIYGTSLALLPYFLLVAVFFRYVFAKMNQKILWLVFLILSFNLIISHAITALFVSFLLIGMLIILKSFEITRKRFPGRFSVSALIVPTLSYVVLLMTWWMNTSAFYLNTFAHLMLRLFVGGSMIAPVPTRFSEIPLLPQLQILTVLHLRDALIGMLSLFGLLLFLRKSRRNELSDKTKTFYLYLLAFLGTSMLFLSSQFAFGFGAIQYTRFIAYTMPLFSFLVGLALWRFNESLNSVFVKPRIRNLAFAFFLFILVSACLIQFYHCQPLVPKSNALSKDLPEDEYLVYIGGGVNTIYQIKMISFAEVHFHNGRIASDYVTRYQIYGFSSPSFFSRHIWHSPLIPNPDQNLKWDLLLLHSVEAGPLSEPAEYRTKERIEDFRLKAGNVIYDNEESFILSHFPN